MLKLLVLFALSLFAVPGFQPNKKEQQQGAQRSSSRIDSSDMQGNQRSTLESDRKDGTEAAVRIISAPPKDAYDKAGLWINSVLAGVGLIGIVIAVSTLQSVKHQTVSIRESVETMVKTERPWVMVNVDWQPGPHLAHGTGSDGDTTGIYVELICVNEGKSFAQIIEKGYVFKIVHSLPQEPDFNHIDVFHHASEYISPNSSTVPYRLSPMCAGHLKPNNMMVLYGRVKYRGIYGTHETCFGYQITGMGNLERLPVSSYPKYNEHT